MVNSEILSTLPFKSRQLSGTVTGICLIGTLKLDKKLRCKLFMSIFGLQNRQEFMINN
jgi:hypothetical protein